MKKFFKEFKDFALRGNVMDLAVGVIIGAAFQSVVASLTENILSPIIGLITRQNFDSLQWDVFGDGALVFRYGSFITVLINFVLTAFVIFLLVRGMNRLAGLGKKETPAAAPTTKKCPYCFTEIPIEATKCPNCTADLPAAAGAAAD